MQGPDFDGFAWDTGKSDRCFRERGFDFDYATQVFEGAFIGWEDHRGDHGEQRFVAVGQVENRILAVVWTPRENIRRIISARPASRSERETFYADRETHQQGDS
jgi:uncharacterized DUF497 family protein